MIGIRRLPGIARDVPAGLLDAGMASLAHFVVGVASVNLLGEADLGVYAVFFAAFMVSAIVPQFLVFTPAEIIAVAEPVESRLRCVWQSLRLGVGPTVIGAFSMVIAAAATASDTDSQVTVALLVTGGIAVLVSPAQDHVRRLLHIAKRSWSAASVSVVQFIVVVIGIGGMLAIDVPAPWIPFGALAAANIVSLSVALVLARPEASSESGVKLSFSELVQSGRWLLATALVPFAAGFAGSLLIVKLAGPEALGLAEAARVAAQPILVLAVGLNAVLGPRGMEAASLRDRPMAHRAQRIYLTLIATMGAGYLLIVGHAWVGNPMVYLVPVAYSVSGLVAVTIVAHILTAASVQYSSELMGGRKEIELTKISFLVSPVLLLGSATAAVTGAFARPISVIMESSVRLVVYGFASRRMFSEPEESTELQRLG
jgi:O-antigen/teichoic acid export membrane protein